MRLFNAHSITSRFFCKNLRSTVRVAGYKAEKIILCCTSDRGSRPFAKCEKTKALPVKLHCDIIDYPARGIATAWKSRALRSAFGKIIRKNGEYGGRDT